MSAKHKTVHTLLVRCPNWVGDVVMATPTFDCLKENFPKSRMVGIAKRNAQNILKDGPWFDEFLSLKDKSMLEIAQMTQKIRAVAPDMAVILANSVRSLLPIWLAGVPRIYGYRRQGRGMVIKGPRPKREGRQIVPMPMQEYYMEICRWLKLTPPDPIKPRIFIGSSLADQGNRLLQKYNIQDADQVIGLNPGANFGSSKCWPPEHFARVAELLEDKMNAKIVLFSGPGEEGIAESILSQSRARIIDTTPDRVDLALLKPLVKRCDVLVTNDTGPRHYAVALDVPVVVIMGPTDPRYTAINLERTTVLRKDLPCSPCHKKICPTDHRCMTEILPEEVLAATQSLLGVSS